VIKKMFLFSIFSLCNILYALDFTPSIDFSAYGGKYYLDNKSASFDAKLDLFASYVLNIDEENQVYPIYSGYYNGTQDIQELAGGDVLTRQRMGNSFTLKYKHSKDFNSIKPRLSYSINRIKETKDEKWGSGLFDYNILSAGVEMEQERPEANYKEYFDFFNVDYPNYSSLISQVETVIDTTTYSELSENAGKDVLNSRNYRAGFSYVKFPYNVVLTNDLSITYKDFYDQSVVKNPGVGGSIFKSDKRKDLLFSLSTLLENTNKKVYLSLGVNLDYLNSNQNSYDASRTKYISDFYDYISFEIYPNAKLNFKNGGYFSYSFTYTRMNYLGRYSQDIDGNYLSSKIRQNFYLSSLSLAYPVAKNLYAKGVYSYQSVDSNMRYEAGYRYNYTSESFLIGVEWSF